MRYNYHQPVMADQAMAMLRPCSGGRYVDMTLGLGGHARRILEACEPDGVLLGIERDSIALGHAERVLSPFADRVRIFQGCYSDLFRFLEQVGWSEVDGMLADLGVSSIQLDDPQRGFCFREAGPLDMRMDPQQGRTLDEMLAEVDIAQLAEVLRVLGDVRRPRLMAQRILRAHQKGELTNTLDLARVGSEPGKRKKIHPATRVFMALRIWVNREHDELSRFLDRLPEPLAVGGRAVVISFHSVEDRKVKSRFRELSGVCKCPKGMPVCRCNRKPIMACLNNRPLRPSEDEIDANPRARSALLRVAERVAA